MEEANFEEEPLELNTDSDKDKGSRSNKKGKVSVEMGEWKTKEPKKELVPKSSQILWEVIQMIKVEFMKWIVDVEKRFIDLELTKTWYSICTTSLVKSRSWSIEYPKIVEKEPITMNSPR